MVNLVVVAGSNAKSGDSELDPFKPPMITLRHQPFPLRFGQRVLGVQPMKLNVQTHGHWCHCHEGFKSLPAQQTQTDHEI